MADWLQQPLSMQALAALDGDVAMLTQGRELLQEKLADLIKLLVALAQPPRLQKVAEGQAAAAGKDPDGVDVSIAAFQQHVLGVMQSLEGFVRCMAAASIAAGKFGCCLCGLISVCNCAALCLPG